MGENSKIEWTDHTFSGWLGCTKVSPACDNCYSEALAKRWGWVKWGAGEERKRTSEANWRKPLAWNRKAAKERRRYRVFCASLSDVFDAEVPDDWRFELFALIQSTPFLDWLLLTKRPQVALKFFDKLPIRDNIWLGTTVEDQKMADLRIPILLSIPAKVHFLSCEPLLSNITLRTEWLLKLDWIIAGGESGPQARPSHPDWFRILRDQCQAASVSFFFKQWGAWKPQTTEPFSEAFSHPNITAWPDGTLGNGDSGKNGGKGRMLLRLGKHAAGAVLDGREWREFPR